MYDRISMADSLSFPLWVPGLDVDEWCRSLAFGGCATPSLESLQDLIFCWLLRSPVLMVSGHRIWKILQRQVLLNVWVHFSVTAVVFCVKRTCFTVVLKMLILMLMDKLGRPKCSSFGERLLSPCTNN